MAYKLEPVEDGPLHPYYYDWEGNQCLVTSREDHIPQRFDRVSTDHEPLPTSSVPFPAFHLEGYEYHAFLPRHREGVLACHLFICLDNPRVVHDGGVVRLDIVTKNAWSMLERGLTWTIESLLRGVLLSLNDATPPPAEKYGYSRSHKTLKGLQHSLKLSKHAFLLRLAYLTFIYSLRSPSPDSAIPPWVQDVTQRSHATWVDSLWEVICQQRSDRNFIGALVYPNGSSVRWVKSAAAIGVPIWVLWREGHGGDYDSFDGAFVLKPWAPSHLFVGAAPPPATSTTESHDTLPLPSPPTTALPPGSKFIADCQEFFQKRDAADRAAEANATLSEKQQWENRQNAAKGYHQPGKKGPRVYTWSQVETGGYVRELVDRGDVEAVWENHRRRHMFFNARSNVWDLCTMFNDPAADHSNDDLDKLDDAEEEIGEAMDQWFPTPKAPPSPPDTDLTELAFLYRRYGFLTVEPTTRGDTPKWQNKTTWRIPGLGPTGDDRRLDHLADFNFAILQRRLPDGHCDLSENSPDNELFPFSTPGLVDRIVPVKVPDLGDGRYFLFEPSDHRVKILVHDPLAVAEMGRAQVQPESAPVVDYLLRNGSRFTVLTSQTENMNADRLHILSFPVRPMGWIATAGDYHHYMSTLKLVLTDRPYVAAAALARGGIAWRITREVLGLDIDLVLNGPTFTGMATSVQVLNSTQWHHSVDEQEWYYLVGGYCVLTGSCFVWIPTRPTLTSTAGKGHQTVDTSWWPKVTTWDGCGLDAGCWTPQCERWFKQRLEKILQGTETPKNTKTWDKNLRYEKESKAFFSNAQELTYTFLTEKYPNFSV
jgi:hypothetical protein